MALLSLLLALCAALPQTPEEDQSALEAAKAKVGELKEATSDEDKSWLTAYQERVAFLEELIRTGAALAALPTATALEQERSELEAELEGLRAQPELTEVQLGSVDELPAIEQAAKAAGAELVNASAAVSGLETRVKEFETELGGLQARGERAKKRGEELAGEDELARYRVESARLEARVVSERAGFLTQALSAWNARQPVLELQLEKTQLASDRATKRAELAREAAARMREAEAQAARVEAQREARRAARESDPVERFRHQVRAEAGTRQAEAKAFGTRLEQLRHRATTEAEAVVQVKSERESLEHRLELRPKGVDRLLRRHLERNRRRDRQIDEEILPEIDEVLEKIQDDQAEVLDRLWSLSLPEGENPDLEQFLDEVPAERKEEAREVFATSLQEDGLIDALEHQSDQLEQAVTHLNDVLVSVRERDRLLGALEEFILARMLWTQSDPPIGAREFGSIVKELASIPAPYREDGTWSRLLTNARARLPLVALVIALLVGLHYLTRRLTGWASVAAARPPPLRTTLRALAALGWAMGPVLQLWIGSLGIRALGPAEAFDPPVANLLWYMGELLAMRRVVKVLLGRNGLAIGPHGIDPLIGRQVSRIVGFFTIVGQALYVPYLVLSGVPFELKVLPRLLYMLWIVLGTVALLMLIRPRGPVIQQWTTKGGLLRSVLAVMRVVWLLMLGPLIALDLMGYRVGVETSLLNGLKVFVSLFVLGALFRVLERLGMLLAGRKLEPVSPEEERVLYTRRRAWRSMTRVLAALVVVLVGIGVAEVWGIGGPIMKLAGEFELVELDDGSWLTGRHVLLAFLVVVLGHLISANLRRFHEALIEPFSGTTDVGGRYASITLLRYAITAASYAAAMVMLGISFETLGWFATAASVGLGFGLQEIVANFISGLILLFERPIRVGDIVTIGSTSGTVDSISMRATVITNWERQTITVPNKKFVTENLTNWTGTDSVMRRDFTVRVAYGSDVEKVFRVLEDTVKAHPAVLEKPEPMFWLQEFGLIGIEFKALFYTSIDVGLGTRSQIQSAVKVRFEQEGIEMSTLDPEAAALVEQGEQSAKASVSPPPP